MTKFVVSIISLSSVFLVLLFSTQIFSRAVVDNEEIKLNQTLTKTIETIIQKEKVVLFSKTYCRFSKKAKKVLEKYNLKNYEIIELDKLTNGEKVLNVLVKISGISTVPQLFIGGEFIGDSKKIVSKDESGRLRELLIEAEALHDNRPYRHLHPHPDGHLD
uniref:Glutaredoxin domain-containing protein n=1 Tax=Rhabditophanes sp. KR3021 TaxID=114890 RepID=A0AC35U6I1_9BILA